MRPRSPPTRSRCSCWPTARCSAIRARSRSSARSAARAAVQRPGCPPGRDALLGRREAIEVAELPAHVVGEEIELSVRGEERIVTVDGMRSFAAIPELEALAAARGARRPSAPPRRDGLAGRRRGPVANLGGMSSALGGFEKVLRLGEGRRLKRAADQAAYIATLEPTYEAMSDEELRGLAAVFRERHANGETVDDLLFEAYAAVREARERESGQRIFDVQMMGGIVLHEGDIAEMKTGEGKTLTASMPMYLNALDGHRRATW